MTLIYRASDLLNAHVVAGLLKTNGIDCEVRGESLVGAIGELPLTDDVLPSVWLRDASQMQLALRLIERFEAPPNLATQWNCESRGEINEANFDICWKCHSEKK